MDIWYPKLYPGFLIRSLRITYRLVSRIMIIIQLIVNQTYTNDTRFVLQSTNMLSW